MKHFGALLLILLSTQAANGQTTGEKKPEPNPPAVTDAASGNGALEVDEDLRAARARIENEQYFHRLREERRDLLREGPKLKAEIDALQAAIGKLKIEQGEQEAIVTAAKAAAREASTWEPRRSEAEKRLVALDKRGKRDDQSSREYEIELFQARKDLAYLQEQERVAKEAAQEGQEAEKRAGEIGTRLVGLEQDLKEKQSEYDANLTKQFLVDDKINVLLIPATATNRFKLYITGAFSILVALVIAGFFAVAAVDGTVRQSIFSSQSGIQFLTLFSLVIAIILFGITDILGGKELSALLGGISGYLLGRVGEKPTEKTTPVAEAPPKPTPA